MREAALAYDHWQILSPPDNGLIFVPRYNRNQLWIQRKNDEGQWKWDERANWEAGQNDSTLFSDPNLRVTRRNPRDAEYFQGNARRICDYHGWPHSRIIEIDNGAPNAHGEGDDASEQSMRTQVLEAITTLPTDEPPLSLVIFICHGWKTGIQFGFSIKNSFGERNSRHLLEEIARRSREDLILPIYGCSTAGGDNGGEGHFADFVRDTLCDLGIESCRVDGHTVAGRAMESPWVRRFEGAGNRGGEWVIDPGQRRRNPTQEFIAWRHALENTNLKYRYSLMSTESIRAEVAALV